MPDDTLEQVRLLSNLESNRHKLLQIVLFGQPELDDDARQAEPAPAARPHHALASACGRCVAAEVAKYLSFRMRAAGYRGPEVFTPRAVARIARASGGLTRRINILADKALLAAYTENTHAITHKQVRAAVADSEFAAPRRSSRPSSPGAAAGCRAGIAVGAGRAVDALAAGTKRRRSRRAGAVRPAVVPLRAAVQGRPACRAEPVKPEPEPLPEPPSRRSRARRLFARRDSSCSAGAWRRPRAARAQRRRRALRARAVRHRKQRPGAHGALPACARATWCRWRRSWSSRWRPAAQYRLWVLFGDFASREEALAAARRLPPRYQEAFRAAPRSFGELRRQL